MNGKQQPFPPPPQPHQISVFELINVRIGLAQITHPSEDLKQAILNLDMIIVKFTNGLVQGE